MDASKHIDDMLKSGRLMAEKEKVMLDSANIVSLELLALVYSPDRNHQVHNAHTYIGDLYELLWNELQISKGDLLGRPGGARLVELIEQSVYYGCAFRDFLCHAASVKAQGFGPDEVYGAAVLSRSMSAPGSKEFTRAMAERTHELTSGREELPEERRDAV